MLRRSRDELQDELLRRMAEPEPLRSLRLQLERIEHEREQELHKMFADMEAARIRKEIKRQGHKPCT